MKYFIIAGELSGDLHGSNLMKAILRNDPSAQFQYWGGSHMENIAQGKIIDISETSIMGFVEVLANIRKLKGFFSLTKKAILDFNPAVVIFIDYPGFNLRMARWVKRNNFKTAYYISPQVWAWKKERKEIIRKYIDKLIVILPFEVEWYKNYGISAHYVGHPLLEAIDQYKFKNLKQNNPTLALLPGSRTQEVKKILPIMIEAVLDFKNHTILIAGSNHISADIYKPYLIYTNVKLVHDSTYDVIKTADIALVTSGTATLETALIGTPQVVCYKTSTINYTIGKQLVDLKYISLVNLILDEKAVPELIQSELNKKDLKRAIKNVLNQSDFIKSKYKKLNMMLTNGALASELAAEIVINLTKD